ncbi:MAG: amino acid permease, partial [Clostridia bacterium]|nr:amino acid permease [Clostridia bacterium]
MTGNGTERNNSLSPYLSSRAVWALAVGTSVGWGALVVTGSSYLSQSGPVGSVIGIVLGGLIMLVISRCFAYMSERYPSAGGIYTYTKNAFGYDRAFLVSWFLILVYISMFWANATAIPLFADYLLGDIFRFGYLYTLFGYDVYIGEALLTIAAIALVTLLCIKSKSAAAHVMVALAAVFVIGIAACFFAAIFGHSGRGQSYSPGFVPGSSGFSQILTVLFISPWAFIGFEGVTHSSEEYKFQSKKLFRVLVVSVITTTLIYVFVTLLSVTAYPPEYESWLDYINNLGSEEGIRAVPAFYAAQAYLGNAGIAVISASLFALVVTSLIGNLRALSRLFYALAQDGILPSRFAKLNKKSIPARAMILVFAISAVIPFLGRTAIGWIVDVTTVGSTLVYGFAAAAVYKTAKKEGDKKFRIIGAAGFVIMLALGVYLLMPDILSRETIRTETYFLFIVWSILGFIYFRRIIAKDHARRFGKAIIVWIALLSLVVFAGIIWTQRIDESITKDAIYSVRDYYDGASASEGSEFVESVVGKIHSYEIVTTFAVVGLFGLSLGIMLVNYFSMKKWENKAINERDVARDAAYRDPLTGVKSKHAYVDRESETDRAIESGAVAAFAVAVCDVNGLKHINDTLGHQAGDAYIKRSAALICEHFKHSPVYRIGGDEFAVILEGQDYEGRERIIEELDRIIEGNVGTENA